MDARWFRLARKILASNFERLKYPYKLTYVVTKECHSQCLNCDIWKVKPHNELTLAEVSTLAKNSPFLSWVDFTGGEPTDRQDFVDVVQAFVESCPDLLLVHFPTNGLKPKRIAQVADSLKNLRDAMLVITVSIDGPPELNDKLRGIPKDFARAVETYTLLKAMPHVRVYIGMTLYPENTHLVKETVAAIAEQVPGFSYADIHLNIPHVSAHYYENSATAPKATLQMADAVEELMKLRGIPLKPFEWVERLYQRKVRRYLASGITPIGCASLMSSCFLAENGTLYPCIIWSEPLGNIRDHGCSLVPLLRSPKARELRAAIKLKQCPNCWTPCEAYQSLAASLL